MRRLHAHVAGLKLRFLRQLLQLLKDGPALGQPQRQARPGEVRVEREEVHLRANLAVVAALGLLLELEPLLERGLVLEGRAVDALELRAFLVALVVGGGHGGELERADVAGAHHVRPGAEVNEVAVLEVGDRLALGDVLEQVELELAGVAGPLGEAAEASALRVGDGLLARDGEFLEDVVGLNLLLHLLLELGEVLGGDAVGAFEVVVEAILDRRPVGELGVRPQTQDGGGQDVSA